MRHQIPDAVGEHPEPASTPAEREIISVLLVLMALAAMCWVDNWRRIASELPDFP